MTFVEFHSMREVYKVPIVDRQTSPGLYTDFFCFLESLGERGREDLIKILAVKYGDEVMSTVNRVARGGK